MASADAEITAAADGWANRIVEALADRQPRLGSCRVVALDGPAGAGKTTLARLVVERLSVDAPDWLVDAVAMDDLYEGWSGLDDRLVERARDEVIAPLARGGVARWQPYDWSTGHFAGERVTRRGDVLVVEGCGSGSLPLAPWLSLLVWVDGPETRRRDRALARDGEVFAAHWNDWAAAERVHFAAHDTARRADLRVQLP